MRPLETPLRRARANRKYERFDDFAKGTWVQILRSGKILRIVMLRRRGGGSTAARWIYKRGVNLSTRGLFGFNCGWIGAKLAVHIALKRE